MFPNVVSVYKSLTIDPNFSIPLIRFRPLLNGISDDTNSFISPLIGVPTLLSICRPSTDSCSAQSPGHRASIVRSSDVMMANS
jgi:hypothetical protein